MTTLAERLDVPASGTGYRTVAAMVAEWAEKTPDSVAMREKDFGIWQEITWSQFYESVLHAAHGLLALGVREGDRVSIQSEDRPEWIILDIATVAIRAITVGLYPTNPAAEVEYLLTDSGAKVHLAEDQEQADKVMEVIDRLPDLTRIIHVEPRGFRRWRDDERFVFWDDFLELGRRHREENPGAVERIMATAEEDDVMTLVYTSGTTGPPKGAMLTNGNVTFCIDVLINNTGRLSNPVGPSDILLTYLPLCHVAERIFSTWTLAANAPTLNFAESIDTVQQNLREIQPTIFFAVPRIWERIHAGILIRLNDATFMKKLVGRPSMAVARHIGKTRVEHGGNFTAGSKLLYWIFNVIYFRSLKERIGLRRCRYAASGAAPIAPEVLEFFMGLGIDIYELYGMTENSAVATTNYPGRTKVGTVGEAYVPGTVKIEEETGEILTKHAGNFKGYWGKPEKTAETFTDDGWLRTGDVGEWVDGTHVKIVDRMKDIIITSGGKNVSPSEIENSLKVSPFIKEAMVIGDRRKYLTALLAIEFETVGDWATRRGIPYTTYRDLSEKPEVIELMQKIVNETNAKLAHVEQIRKFRMIPKELDHEDGELTATQKLKRSAMAEMFGDLIEDMYRS
ncbi:MAG TPA: AMP-binding protein [Acidimicrobiia bacterium]|jgi:long-chain acyl-CoA synthetase|nr:AMP-binding protein [Acidimicrobiia bacterium]